LAPATLPGAAEPASLTRILISHNSRCGQPGMTRPRVQYGLLAGALATGEIGLWDPTAMISKPNPAALIHSWRPSDGGKVRRRRAAQFCGAPRILLTSSRSGCVSIEM
jgi:hypothetical protein